MEQLNCRLQVKSLDEQGRFSGLASTYGNIDLGMDIVMPGAFQKTLQDRGGEVPVLWSHNLSTPIGLGKLKDTAQGLMIEGQLVLSVSKAREAYDLMRAKVIRGLSIGYDAVKSQVVDGARRLLELKLYEVSLVTFPMNPMATVTSVKTDNNFNAEIFRLREMIRQCREGWR